MNKNNNLLNLEDIFECKKEDVEMLNNYLVIAKDFGIEISDIKEYLDDFSEMSIWFLMTLKFINDTVIVNTEDELKYNAKYKNINSDLYNKLKSLRENFNPTINYLSYSTTSFNNILDDIDLTQDMSKVCNELIEKLQR